MKTKLFAHVCISRMIYIASIPFVLNMSSASAGGDVSCYATTDIQSNEYTACDALPILSPANDNQVNMLLMLNDLGLAQLKYRDHSTELWQTTYSIVPFETRPFILDSSNKIPSQRMKANVLSEVDSEHCVTLENGKDDFIRQIQNDQNMTSNEKQLLIQARQKISECPHEHTLIAVDKTWSINARQYASYLNGVISFYNTNFSTATDIFLALTHSKQAWIKETSYYMLIRSQLNQTFQSGLGEYGDFDKTRVNKTLLINTFESIKNYLKFFPKGQYRASARGLLRRCYWVASQQQLLVDELTWQLHNPKSPYYNLELPNIIFEMDRHVFQSSFFDAKHLKDPFFMAIYDLMLMRKPESSDDKVISWNELNQQKKLFKTTPELFKFLQANHLFYVQDKPQDALKYLPQKQISNPQNTIELSQIFLKGRILEKTHPQQGQHYWEYQLKQAETIEQRSLFELTLYNYYAKQQKADFFSGSTALIQQPFLQQQFISTHANEKSLMNIVQNATANEEQKNLALQTVLAKSLAHQNYALFNQAYTYLPKNASQYVLDQENFEYYKQQPPLGNFIWNGTTIHPNIQCPALQILTQKLEKKPQDLHLQLCLGEYVRSSKAQQIQDLYYVAADHSSFSGKLFTRGQVYKNIHTSSLSKDYKAYALYRSIMCYSPSGFNECQDSEVPTHTRKQWYETLKRDYAQTTWAKSLKYYW